MKSKLLCATLIAFMSTSAAINDCYSQEKSEMSIVTLIDHFFNYLSCLGKQNKIDFSSLQKYMHDECVIQSNNEILCQGINGFIDYINRMQQKYESVNYCFLEKPIISDDKAVLHFQVECLTKAEEVRHLIAIAIVTIQNGKIRYWKEVFQDLEQNQ